MRRRTTQTKQNTTQATRRHAKESKRTSQSPSFEPTFPGYPSDRRATRDAPHSPPQPPRLSGPVGHSPPGGLRARRPSPKPPRRPQPASKEQPRGGAGPAFVAAKRVPIVGRNARRLAAKRDAAATSDASTEAAHGSTLQTLRAPHNAQLAESRLPADRYALLHSPDGVVGPVADPRRDGAVLPGLLGQLGLDAERLLRRLREERERATTGQSASKRSPVRRQGVCEPPARRPGVSRPGKAPGHRRAMRATAARRGPRPIGRCRLLERTILLGSFLKERACRAVSGRIIPAALCGPAAEPYPRGSPLRAKTRAG